MGFSIKSGGEDDLVENGEIDVTPFIDVILVLLIIFMVAAPISTVDVPVDLPASSAQPAPRQDKPVYVTLKADLSLAVGDEAVDWARLGSVVDMATGIKRETRLFLRADKTIPYGDIMKLFNELRANGYLRVALVALDAAPTPGVAPAPAEPAARETR
ncbi:MAG: TonB system transport protein ExbD [Rhizobiales bacterium PAR1]|nr:MAG: TonB system transport protein ExbD [Rhizobiales bacterium PAR1]